MKKILYVLGIILLAVSALLFMKNYWKEEIIASINQIIEEKFTAVGLISNSEVGYPGASVTNAFVANNPYMVKVRGALITRGLNGASRAFDFSGNVSFVDPTTGTASPQTMQAWDPVFAKLRNLCCDYNLSSDDIKTDGFPGRVDKQTINGIPTTMVRYNAYDGTTAGKCRSQLISYDIPPRAHIRLETEVAFGNADGVNNWTLTPSAHWGGSGIDNGGSPVSFFGLTSNAVNNLLNFHVDTDNLDATKLMIYIVQNVGPAQGGTEIVTVHGLSRHTMIPIVVEAFLDERTTENGGKGVTQIWINNVLVFEKAGQNLPAGDMEPPHLHYGAYLWNESAPYKYTRAVFFKTARLLVFPINTTAADTTPPSVPLNLQATSTDSSTVNLSWTASTDNVGVAGYRIYRDGTQIGTSTVASLTDNAVTGGITYGYTVKASDIAGNLSAASQTVTVTVNNTPPAAAKLSISSISASSITANSAKIKWTTNVSSSVVVSYGNTTNLGSSYSHTALTTSHSATITGLSRQTKYYYKITATTKTGDVATSLLGNFTTARR